MSDLAFLLIIFFILMAGTVTTARLRVPTPSISTSSEAPVKPMLTVQISADGTARIPTGSTLTPTSALEILQAERHAAMRIIADTHAPWASVIPYIGICQETDTPILMEALP